MTWFPVLLAIAMAAGYVLYQMWQRRERNYGFPVVAPPPGKDVSWALAEGHRRYPNTPFIVPTQEPYRVILPMSLMNEVIHAPNEKMSFTQEVYDLFLGRYTKVGENRQELIHTVRADLTKNMSGILPILQAESKYGLEKELGSPEDWTTISLYPKVVNLVALLSGRAFVGLPLSRDEEWLKMTIQYTLNLADISESTSNWSPMIKPLVAPFLRDVRKATISLERATKYVEPLVRDILAQHGGEKTGPAKAGSRGSFISWILSNSPDELRTARRVGESQLSVSFAAIHTTSQTSTLVLLNLATYPEYIQALREEIEKVISEDGMEIDEDGNSYLGKSSFAKLKLLDSFIKESQRVDPINFINSARRLMVDYTFSNGLKLRKGTRIAFPMWGVSRSEKTPLYSPEYNKGTGNPGPEVFDGYRFLRLRNIPGREMRHQAVTTGPDATSFGHGPHACPGRFFAIYEIKVMVVDILMNYDIRLKGDVEGRGGLDMRPKSLASSLAAAPRLDYQVDIRRRKL